MQINRLFEIAYLLTDKKKVTAKELAEHFEVSRRTILRDVETLSAAGIPIYTQQGKGGGISIMDHFVLNKAILSENEKDQILFALQSLAAVKNIDTETVLGKLQSFFGQTDTSWIEVDFSRWGRSDLDQGKFEVLKTAILGKRKITFCYFSSNGVESRRVVCPLKLVFKSKFWYLQAFCLKSQDYRTFKINRIVEVTETGESFADSSYTPPPIEASQQPVDSLAALVLTFSPRVAYRVYDEFDEGCIEMCDNGWLRVSVKLPENDWLYGFLRSFGRDIDIISPVYLKEKIESENIR